MEKDFTVEVVNCSKELSKKELVMIKDLTRCESLNDIVTEQSIVVKPVMTAELRVHNEHSKDNKDYTVYIVQDETGAVYKSGSKSFFTTLTNIIDDMSDSEEEWAVNIYTKPSKNYKGKDFITCSVV